LTRKKLIKLLMAEGLSRNDARFLLQGGGAPSKSYAEWYEDHVAKAIAITHFIEDVFNRDKLMHEVAVEERKKLKAIYIGTKSGKPKRIWPEDDEVIIYGKGEKEES